MNSSYPKRDVEKIPTTIKGWRLKHAIDAETLQAKIDEHNAAAKSIGLEGSQAYRLLAEASMLLGHIAQSLRGTIIK